MFLVQASTQQNYLQDALKILLENSNERDQISCKVNSYSCRFGNTQQEVDKLGFSIVSEVKDIQTGECLSLFKRKSVENTKSRVINVSHDDWSWLDDVKEAMDKSDWSEVWLVASSSNQKQQKTKGNRDSVPSGLLGLFNCLRREPGGEKLR